MKKIILAVFLAVIVMIAIAFQIKELHKFNETYQIATFSLLDENIKRIIDELDQVTSEGVVGKQDLKAIANSLRTLNTKTYELENYLSLSRISEVSAYNYELSELEFHFLSILHSEELSESQIHLDTDEELLNSFNELDEEFSTLHSFFSQSEGKLNTLRKYYEFVDSTDLSEHIKYEAEALRIP